MEQFHVLTGDNSNIGIALFFSEADKQITQKIKNAAEYLDIKILDHLILTPNGDYFSFSDNGLLS